ncbi:MAG: replication-associated recombination protein A [Candidatus Pacebacteria bacterium]|nr:replication-associated recombination protein A [Candidatus Paceibacterota bacterium]
MNQQIHKIPLADRMRPETLVDFVGQEKLLGQEKILRKAIETDNIPSIIFWGPPGSGKTTIAFVIAKATKGEFMKLSATTSGVKDVRGKIKKAEELKEEGKKTIMFIDEIHRFNKSQQDTLLSHIENGTIVLVGATTENPSFEVNNALLSRCRVFVLEKLGLEHIKEILKRALKDKKIGLGNLKIKISEKDLQFLAKMSDGDARVALNALEFASDINEKIDKKIIEQALQKSLAYDKNGEEHYNIISALHKSMRGGDADASLYWLARMLEGGENPLYVARRLIRFASEDIGIANSRALDQAISAYQACHFIGIPECNVNLAQAVVYMAKSKKSNELYKAYGKAVSDVRKFGNLPVPLHIRNAPTKLMKDLDYGKGYKYSPDFKYEEKQEYFPEKLKKRKYLNFE